ncbi:MAG: LysM peptidoglycan-binding domain-containing protein [Candidatus Omnitrophica bacterium]|nr:LysM peptidoglycan-binding domain-containing protein [Candidatus Omnitrophota bacterium]
MNKKITCLTLFIIVFTGISVLTSGCAKRVKIETIEKERIDQGISGNRGFFSGNPPPADETKEKFIKREIYQVTLDLPPYPEWKNFRFEPTNDKDLWGNRGYVYGGPGMIAPQFEPQTEQDLQQIALPEETAIESGTQDAESVTAEERPDQKVEESYKTYIVKKGDTLQKISVHFYGSTKKWKQIFDLNSDTLKNPNKIYPGQKIKIPQ